MPSGLRVPRIIPPPDRDGYTDTYEETRSRVDMEIGPGRVRNRTTIAPRTFTVQWTMTDEMYRQFDIWWEESILGASVQFDVQLLDDTEQLMWYTVKVLDGTYRARKDSERSDAWIVSLTVRTISAPFAVRLPGTNELEGYSDKERNSPAFLLIPKVLFGVRDAETTRQGALVYLPFFGVRDATILRRGILRPRPFFGEAVFGYSNTGQLQDFGDPELILKFDAVEYDSPDDGDDVLLKFDSTVYYPPHIA